MKTVVLGIVPTFSIHRHVELPCVFVPNVCCRPSPQCGTLNEGGLWYVERCSESYYFEVSLLLLYSGVLVYRRRDWVGDRDMYWDIIERAHG